MIVVNNKRISRYLSSGISEIASSQVDVGLRGRTPFDEVSSSVSTALVNGGSTKEYKSAITSSIAVPESALSTPSTPDERSAGDSSIRTTASKMEEIYERQTRAGHVAEAQVPSNPNCAPYTFRGTSNTAAGIGGTHANLCA